MPAGETPPHERRVWRLAFLLTGDTEGAAALAARIPRTQPDLASMEPAMLDRMVVQEARLMAQRRPPAGRPARPDMPPDAARSFEAALAMPRQPLEAWVLTRLDDLDPLRVCRAMDCSRTAAARHLAAADEQMKNRLLDQLDRGIVALRAAADALDPAPAIARRREQDQAAEKRRRIILTGAAAVALLGIALAVLKMLL